jgi:hypothetical protein
MNIVKIEKIVRTGLLILAVIITLVAIVGAVIVSTIK